MTTAQPLTHAVSVPGSWSLIPEGTPLPPIYRETVKL
jgi:hypothetical protein